MSLPPSRFGAGFTVGGPPAGAASAVAHTTPAAGSPSAAVPRDGRGTLTPANELNGLALLSFVSVLLLGPLVVVASIPLALIARTQIARRGQSGAGLVIAALALSVIYLAFGVLVLLLLLYAQSSTEASA